MPLFRVSFQKTFYVDVQAVSEDEAEFKVMNGEYNKNEENMLEKEVTDVDLSPEDE